MEPYEPDPNEDNGVDSPEPQSPEAQSPEAEEPSPSEPPPEPTRQETKLLREALERLNNHLRSEGIRTPRVSVDMLTGWRQDGESGDIILTTVEGMKAIVHESGGVEITSGPGAEPQGGPLEEE